MQDYSNPERASNSTALPDVEVWEAYILECGCGLQVPADELGEKIEHASIVPCCGAELVRLPKTGWFYWYCYPGCLPDSDWYGPYESLEEARAEYQAFQGRENELPNREEEL